MRITKAMSWRSKLSVATCTAVAAVTLSSSPAQALAPHIFPVCSSTANEAEWRYETRAKHSPQNAVDINWRSGDADRGRWVVASAAGTIHSKPVAKASSYGKQVIIKHGSDDFTQYAHLEWVTSLKPGTKVAKGQLIGTIGYSLDSSGGRSYHLHYEQRKTSTGSLRKVVINGSQLRYFGEARFSPTHVSPSCR